MSDDRRHPHAGHVEPADLGGRGTGDDAAAHRLLHLGARGGRPFRRRLRPAGADAGAGGHRHARPRQHHGRGGAAFHGRDPARGDVPGRHLRHQRSRGRARATCTTSPWCRRPSSTATLVGFFACTAHVVDVGGRGFGADGKSVYEEGIQIPIMKFAERGEVNCRPRRGCCAPMCASRTRWSATSTRSPPATTSAIAAWST